MEDRERVARLEARAREAEETIRQISAYLEILKKHASGDNSDFSCAQLETKKLEAENSELKSEVSRLKTRLFEVETRNGVQQVSALSHPLPPPLLLLLLDAIGGASGNKPCPGSIPPQAKKSHSETKQQESGSQPMPSSGAANQKKGREKAQNEAKAKEKTKGGGPSAQQPVDVSRLDMRIGRIVSVEKHPDADTLYVEKVETGEPSQRTVVSGLVKHYTVDEMTDRLVVLLCNLKPAKMRGVTSEAMVMCASSPEKVEFLDPPPGCAPGELVTFQGYAGQPDQQLNPKKKIFEQIQPDLQTNEEGVACYRGVAFAVEGKGVCKAATMTLSGIK